MIRYRYKAINREGALQRGVIETNSPKEVNGVLYSLNLSPISYSRDFLSYFQAKPKNSSLLEFCLYLEQFEKASIPLKDSLEELKCNQTSSSLKSIIANILSSIEGGDLFSKALSKYPRVFDSLFVSLIQMGEKTGNMSNSYAQLIHHLKWVEAVHLKSIKALRYPLILSIILCGLIITLLTFLVPQLIKFFDTPSTDLPFSTNVLIMLSAFLSNYILALFVGICVVFLLMLAFFKIHPVGDFKKDWILNHIPLVGFLRKYFFFSRFFHIFSTLFKNGIDILQALQTARQSLPSGNISSAIKETESLIQDGLSLSLAFQRVGVFPSIVIRMVKIGEQTSSLPKSLEHLKDYFERNLKRRIDTLLGALEPIMLLTIGLVMAWIVCAVFLPLYETISSLDY